MPAEAEEWKKPSGIPLITSLGVVEGDVLTHLEQHGATTLRGLIRELEWPGRLIMMALGALIREHLVQARAGVSWQ